jgi:enoyl-CoA hydratase
VESSRTLVTVDPRDDGVTVLTLSQPPVNAMDNALLEQLALAAESLREDPNTRAVVLTGSGEKAFAAGARLDEFAAMLGHRSDIRHHTELSAWALRSVERLPQPVVAAVQASAMGGGLELALTCDLIVVDERARLGVPEVSLGLIPGAGGTQRLWRRVGPTRAAEMILLARPIDAARALELGLVNEVAPTGEALERALAMATRIAQLPARAVQAAKHALREGRDLPLREGLALEREQFEAVLQTDDAREGVQSFLERRPPAFRHT